VPPGLPGARVVGLEEGLTERGRGHRLLALRHVGQGIAGEMHDPNAIGVVRFAMPIPFAGAGLSTRRRRSDAHFP
jgi:hypothetical protein